jgi:hypothetical protein
VSLSLCGYLNNVDVSKPLWQAEPRDKSLCHLCFYFIYILLVDLSLYLAYILCFRFFLLWCACVVCRDFIDTLGNPCGSPTLGLVCSRTRRGDLHIVGSVCVKPVWPVLETSLTGFSTDSGLNFYKCADLPIYPPSRRHQDPFNKPMGQSPYFLVYSSEAILPVDVMRESLVIE